MQRFWSRSALVCGVALLGVSFVAGFNRAEARPKYKKQFETMYPEVVKNHGKKGRVTCAVCHPVKDNKKKKKRNAYGEAIQKNLEKKNEKDSEKIDAALKKAEEAESSTEGKTFGDLLKEGKLPDPKEDEEEE